MCTNNQQMKICWIHLQPWSSDISYTPEHFSQINRLSFPQPMLSIKQISIQRFLNFCGIKLKFKDLLNLALLKILEDPLQ